MATLADFLANPVHVTGTNAFGMNAQGLAAAQAATIAALHAAGPHAIDPVNFTMCFTITKMAELHLITILPAGTQGAHPCYFLPYKRDTAISMQLGAGADFFFTSGLDGCSMHAFGAAATPTVTHANARQAFMNTKANREIHHNVDASSGAEKIRLQRLVEAEASLATQVQVDMMMPVPPNGVQPKWVRKNDYVGNMNYFPAAAAALNIGKFWHRKTPLTPSLYNNYKPEIGGTIIGMRDTTTAATGWSLYCQSNIDVVGERNTGLITGRKWKPIRKPVLLGPLNQFFP